MYLVTVGQHDFLNKISIYQKVHCSVQNTQFIVCCYNNLAIPKMGGHSNIQHHLCYSFKTMSCHCTYIPTHTGISLWTVLSNFVQKTWSFFRFQPSRLYLISSLTWHLFSECFMIFGQFWAILGNFWYLDVIWSQCSGIRR